MPNDYEIPYYGTAAPELHQWLLKSKLEGQAWLETQRPAVSWPIAEQMMAGNMDGSVKGMSNTQYPKGKRIARELVASLASFRHEGEFKVQWDETLYDTAHMLTQVDRHWYETTFANLKYRKALQYAVIKGTGYLYEIWDPTFWGPVLGGDIKLIPLAPENVTFVQLPSDGDIQGAYMTIIRISMPINAAKRLFWRENPAFAASLVPDRQQPGWIQKGLKKLQQFLAPALRVAGHMGNQNSDQAAYPEVDIFFGYTRDNSVNRGFEPMQMGKEGTNWAYTVPYVGQPIPTDKTNPETGQPYTRPAREDECLLFPTRRMTVFSNTATCSDGPSPWWHGDVPLTRIAFNDLPWEALGGSIIADVASMEAGIEALMQAMEDAAAARLDPPALYDDAKVSSSWMDGFNPRKAGVRAAADLAGGAPVVYPVPPEYYNVPQFIPAFMEAQEGRIDYITGVRDLVAMAKAKQVPGADTLEKLMEMAGPIVQDMVRALEEPMTQLGNWRKAYYFQFYSQAKLINITGPDDGVEQMDSFQFASEKLKETVAKGGMMKITPDALNPQGAKPVRMVSEFRYEITRSGLNEMYRMSNKLLYLQLRKEGFPISSWTLAKVCEIPNFGPPPAGTNTEYERWLAEQRMQFELKMEIAQEMQQMQMGDPTGAAAMRAGGGGGRVGRPNSYQEAPRIQTKDGGARSTVTTS